MSDKFDRADWIRKAKLAGIAAAAIGITTGAALLSYWSVNYFGLKKLRGYIAPAPVHVDDAHLADQPLKINYRVLNLDKYAFNAETIAIEGQM